MRCEFTFRRYHCPEPAVWLVPYRAGGAPFEIRLCDRHSTDLRYQSLDGAPNRTPLDGSRQLAFPEAARC